MREWEAECSSCMMLARKWMEAHDRLKAGKPYDLPKPADLPNAVKQLEAENKRLREALAFYGRPYSWRRSGMTMKGPQPSAAELDGGERARAVLSKAQEQSK